MGLDMFAYRTKAAIAAAVDFDAPANREQISYWRKHPNLHGWMEALYVSKGGRNEFNCVNLKLDRNDLDRLESAIRNDALPPTTGFFFGRSMGDESDEDLDFIEKARNSIREGYTVYYTSWW